MSNLIKISFKNFLLNFLFKGFIADIILAYTGLRDSFDKQLYRYISESRLLAYSFFISVILFLQRLPSRVSQNPEYIDIVNLDDRIGIDFFSSIFFVPIFLYIIAFLLHIFCIPFGTRASYFDTRLAFFWSTIVYSPILLLISILEVVFINFWLTIFLKFFSIFCYAWIFSSILSQAHKFSTNIYIFLLLIFFYLFFTILNIK